MVAPASLANLATAPAFQPGHVATRRSSDVDRAIRKLRRSSPEAVELCLAVMRDRDHQVYSPELRVKVALAIIEKALPDQRVKQIGLDDSIGSITIHIERAAAAPTAPTIDAEPDNTPSSLTFRTICSGSGD
jgi:hypothetical protein